MNIQKCAIVGCGAGLGRPQPIVLLGSGLFNELVLIDINQKKGRRRSHGYRSRCALYPSRGNLCGYL